MRIAAVFTLITLLIGSISYGQSSFFRDDAYERRKRAHESTSRDRGCKDGVRRTNDLVLRAIQGAGSFFTRYLEVGPCGGGINSSTVKFVMEDGRICELDIENWDADESGLPRPNCGKGN